MMTIVKFISLLLVICVSISLAKLQGQNEGMTLRRMQAIETGRRLKQQGGSARLVAADDEESKIIHHFVNHAQKIETVTPLIRVKATTEAPDVLNDDEIAMIQNMLDQNKVPTPTQRRRLSQILAQLPRGQLGLVPEDSLNQGSQVPLSLPKPINEEEDIVMQVQATTRSSAPVSSRLGARVSSILRARLIKGNGVDESPLIVDNMILKAVNDRETLKTTPKSVAIARTLITRGKFCIGRESGDQIPHPNNEKKYVVCLGGSEIVMDCPSTLVYNPFTNLCDRTTDEPSLACTSSPCKNGGTCTDTENYGFTCECAESFSGKTCDISNDPCLSNPCSPNGACSSIAPYGLSIRYYCLCDGGNTYGTDCVANKFDNPCGRQTNEAYHASGLSKSLFLHCENDQLNLKACSTKLVWSQKKLTCITQEQLDLEALEEQEAAEELTRDESNFDDHNGYEFVDENF